MFDQALGQNVYFLDATTKDVLFGTVAGMNISTTGYCLVQVISKRGKHAVESAHIHATKKEAEAHKVRVLPLIMEAERRMKEDKAYVDDIRMQVIGKPEYLELAKAVMKQ